MTDPTGQTTNQPPPVNPPHPPSAPPQSDVRPPVVVQHDGEALRNIQSGLTELQQRLGAMPEAIANSFREATGTGAQTPPPTQPAGQQPLSQSQTPPNTPPPVETGTGKVAPKYKPSRFARWWMGS